LLRVINCDAFVRQQRPLHEPTSPPPPATSTAIEQSPNGIRSAQHEVKFPLLIQ
jgi:hypothetical protein